MSDAGQEGLPPNAIGERLRIAREARNMSLDDVARVTRVPTRHLEHIENNRWEALPAITYSVGFARAYANAVGLDGPRIAAELREQLGSSQTPSSAAPYYEPADPARVPPRSLALVTAAIAILLAIAYLVWRSGAVDDSAVDESQVAAAGTPLTADPSVPAPGFGNNQPLAGPAAASGGPVVITATDDVWMRVYEAGGGALFENNLSAGERFEVPSNAQRPLIRTGRPNAIRVTVGSTVIPALGPAERTIADVSLVPRDLLARAQRPAPAAPPR